jgi:AcrR family transcriptional regulator
MISDDSEAAALQPELAQGGAALPRHRHGLTREAVRASQGDRVLAAVAEVVAQRGYAGASIRHIAAQAGVSTKTFYDLYPDKEQAFLATYAVVDVVMGRMRSAGLSQTDLVGVLDAHLRTYLQAMAEWPGFARTLVLEALATTAAVRARRRVALQGFARGISEGLDAVRAAEGRSPGSVADEQLVIGALGGVNELVVQHFGEHDVASVMDVFPAALALLERVCLSDVERAHAREQ